MQRCQVCAAAQAGSSSWDRQGHSPRGHPKAGTRQPSQTCSTGLPPHVPAKEANERLKLRTMVKAMWTAG